MSPDMHVSAPPPGLPPLRRRRAPSSSLEDVAFRDAILDGLIGAEVVCAAVVAALGICRCCLRTASGSGMCKSRRGATRWRLSFLAARRVRADMGWRRAFELAADSREVTSWRDVR
jgi:hypothetical protein